MDYHREQPPGPDEATMNWARQVSREVLAARAEGRPVQLPGPEETTLEWPFPVSREVLAARTAAPEDPEHENCGPSKQQADLLATLTGTAQEPADPVAGIEAALRQYDADVAAGALSLPDAPALPAGYCVRCHQPAGEDMGSVCQYCQALDTLHRPAQTRAPHQRNPARWEVLLPDMIIPAIFIVIGIPAIAAVLSYIMWMALTALGLG